MDGMEDELPLSFVSEIDNDNSKEEIKPANEEANYEEDEDGLMNEEIIENEAKDKRSMYGICKAIWLGGYNIELKALDLAFHSKRRIKNSPVGQGTIRMLTREEWEEFREVRSWTPFESKLARSNTHIRTEELVRMEDLKDWTTDVLTPPVEESVKRNS
ncbi:hypothetical protein NC651_002455 [Populus alba x Populus x berolinensis]|nr:hypothetical protein NC651_002455 [Populus alba x Populus x berolinensis]